MPRAAAAGNVYYLMPIAAGFAYAIIGIVFGAFAGGAHGAGERQAWRLAAWVASAAIFAAHIVYEQRRPGSSQFAVALRVAVGAALGALGWALGAVYHNMHMTPRGHFPLWAIAIWPVITAVPAYLVALVLASLVARVRRTPARPDSAR
jgi:hypothetical protein